LRSQPSLLGEGIRSNVKEMTFNGRYCRCVLKWPEDGRWWSKNVAMYLYNII